MNMQSVVKIHEKVLGKIMRLCPPVPPETGGFLGKRDDLVCEFEFDSGIVQLNRGIYKPDSMRLDAFMEKWNDSGISLCGILHTHMAGQESLSIEDRKFIADIMRLNRQLFQSLYFPIVIPKQGIYFYEAQRKVDRIEIVKQEFISCEENVRQGRLNQ